MHSKNNCTVHPRPFRTIYSIVCVIVSVLLVIIFSSCSNSRIITSWSNRTGIDRAANKIIVLALLPQVEAGLAEPLEKHLSADLNDLGYNAVSAFRLYGPLAFCPGNDSAIFRQLEEKDITVLLTIALLDKKNVERFVPGHYINPVNFMDYVGPKYALLYEPAHIVTIVNYLWETRLYNVSSGKLLYYSQTTSVSPGSIKGMAHEYGRAITKNMIKKKTITMVIPCEE
jgi:hypothetical protein